MEIKFWGTRGSIPVPGKNTVKFGGNTPCISVDFGGDELIILDAGTGIRNLGDEIIRENKFKKIRLFISHTHWDHIQGLPFFAPVYSKDYEIKICVYSYHAGNFKDILETQMHPKYFPVHHESLNAKIKFMRISPGKSYSIKGLKLSTITVNHTRKTLGFKLESDGKSIVYMTDNEIFYDSVPGVPTIEEISEINSALSEILFLL